MKIITEVLKDLYRYWDGKRAGRAMPARSDIDPLEIPQFLDSLLLFDVEADTGRFRARLAGTKIVDFYGADYTGEYLDEIEFGDRRDDILRAYRTCLETKRPSAQEHMFWNIRGFHFKVERILLPLSDDQERVNMVLAGIAFHESRG